MMQIITYFFGGGIIYCGDDNVQNLEGQIANKRVFKQQNARYIDRVW